MRGNQTKSQRLTGSQYEDLERQARKIYRRIARQTKRNPYIRSSYFGKDKVFLKVFWTHLHQKSQYERRKRLRYYQAAIELLRHSKLEPTIKLNPNKREVLYRFQGVTADGESFIVQVKQDLRTSNKHFMSVFPVK